jgi:hypothetical protein
MKFCFDIYPYVSNTTKNKILDLFSIEDLPARIFFKGTNISNLMSNARDQCKYKKDFVKNIKSYFKLYHKSKYNTSWFKSKNVPMSAILYSSVMTNSNIMDFLPEYASILLLAQNLITSERFNQIQNDKLQTDWAKDRVGMPPTIRNS